LALYLQSVYYASEVEEQNLNVKDETPFIPVANFAKAKITEPEKKKRKSFF